jgi:tryptophan synthase alpha chain
MSAAQPHERISAAIRRARADGRVALVPFMTAGYPDKSRFIDTLRQVASAGDVVEIGVPFSDPMADGVTIQRSSHAAICAGVTLRWILGELQSAGDLGAPLVLMSYLNPLLAYGYDELAADALKAGVCGFIVPDLPLEEGADLHAALEKRGLALIHLVTPATPPERMARLCAASRGFVYAVTIKGITGGTQALPGQVMNYLDEVKKLSGDVPVCAGFGVREAEQVRSLGAHADGVIVGSALVEQLEAGHDPAAFLGALREAS